MSIDKHGALLSEDVTSLRGLRRKATAADLVAQAEESIAELQTNVINIKNAKPSLTRIDRGNKDGKHFLNVIFPLQGGDPDVVNLSFLINFPNLIEPFSEAFRLWGSGLAIGTRNNAAKFLRCKFMPFLAENSRHSIDIAQLDLAIWTGYVAYLNRNGKRGQPITQASRMGAYNQIRCLLEALSTSSPWSVGAKKALTAMPVHAWPGYKRRNNPIEPLSDDQIEAIMVAAEHEIMDLQNRWEVSVSLLKEGRQRNELGGGDYRKDFARMLDFLNSTYKGKLPPFHELTKIRGLGNPRVMMALGGLTSLLNQLYPSMREMVPFVLLIANATAYNPDTLFGLKQSEIHRHTKLSGAKVIIVSGTKIRGAEVANPQTRTIDGTLYEGALSFERILNILDNWTSRVRPFVAPEYEDRLFLFRAREGLSKNTPIGMYRSFKLSRDHKNSSDATTWGSALEQFISDHNLTSFTLRDIRPTVMNQVMSRTGDLRSGMKEGLQKQIMTVATHYTSGATKKKFQEQIGEVQHLRNRYHTTGGKLDPRKLSLNQDRACATPGFDCLDAFDSPLRGQSPGKLCDAYGECPACPLVTPNPNLIENVALWLALRKAIYEAQTKLAPETWILKWGPILENLDGLLSIVSSINIKEAAKIPVQLPPVG